VRLAATDKLTGAFALGACFSVALLCWLAYRAVDQWRSRSLLLAERQSSETADLLLNALARDMSGVQTSVLTSPQWNYFITDHPHEVNDLVASAFARYPYPDAFFAWRSAAPSDRVTFFYRAERPPAWLPADSSGMTFPVLIARQPQVSEALMRRVTLDASAGRSLAVFEYELSKRQYQVIAQLTYDDVYKQRLASATGFVVDLDWVRTHYFSDLGRQVWNIGRAPEAGLVMQIRDGGKRLVAGSPLDDGSPLVQRRAFNLLFVDAESAFPFSSGYTPQQWSIAVSGAQSLLLVQDSRNALRLLTFGGVSSLLFAVGLILTVHAARASARLAAMRSDFVSTVTHELKTPIATIKVAAETLAKDRLTGMSVHTCGRIVMMETVRLARLVENLLAYSRITEAADTYSFAPIEVAAVFNDIQEDFEARLDRHGFDLHIEIAPGIHAVKGDRLSLRLLFGNLVDNAIKYSDARRSVVLRATQSGPTIAIQVADSGIGIAQDELPRIVKRFVRGRGAPGSGSGLGLAIASRIASDHHGTLHIASDVGAGTTVTVTLPAA
jgi:signal transduction histidine kinase